MIVFLFFLFSVCSAIRGSVVCEDGDCKVVMLKADEAFVSNSAADGDFKDTLNTTGWGVLNVRTISTGNDTEAMYAAGMLECALSAKEIFAMAHNMNELFFQGQPPPEALLQFLGIQDKWVGAEIANNPNDPLWQAVNLVRFQFEGCVAGYNQNTLGAPPLPIFAFQMLNGVGDFLDLLTALKVRGWILCFV